MTTANVTLLPASITDKPLIGAFLRAYLDEFGFRGTYPYFDQYWQEAERFPLIVSCEGEPAGFAFVRRLDRAHEVAEFYVLPEYRGSGIGRAAVERLFSMFPGAWRIAVQDSNVHGLAFWPRVLPPTAAISSEDNSVVYSLGIKPT